MEFMATLALLAFSSFKDLKTRTVNFYVTLIFSIIGIVLHILYGKRTLFDVCMGLGVGIIMLIAATVTDNAIGRGDAYIIMAAGTLLGGYGVSVVLFIALFLCGMYAFWLLLFRKEKRTAEIPFVPFLLVSFVFYMVIT